MLWYLILGEAILILPYSLNSSFKIILLQLYTKSIKVSALPFLFLSAMLDSHSCSFTSTSILTNQEGNEMKQKGSKMPSCGK
jgi:hypothetical protein